MILCSKSLIAGHNRQVSFGSGFILNMSNIENHIYYLHKVVIIITNLVLYALFMDFRSLCPVANPPLH